jgi:hypothetical protein
MADPKKRARWLRGMKRMNRARRGTGMIAAHPGEYSVWRAMNARCRDRGKPSSKRYGDRGIAVAPEWRGRGGFARFLAHVGPRPSPDHSIDRIENDGHYEPGNVRWATYAEQNSHTSRTRSVTIGGRTQHLAAWAREVGISQAAMVARINAGWSEARLLEARNKTGRRPMR